jgi:hypothetical protein
MEELEKQYCKKCKIDERKLQNAVISQTLMQCFVRTIA